MHWCPGDVHTKRRPASAGTLGERGRGGPSAQVLTLQIIRAIKLPPDQKRERTTGKERLKGHGPGHTQHTWIHTISFFSFSHSFEKTTAIKLVINTFLNALNPCAVYTYTRLKATTSNEHVGGYLHFFTDRILIKIYENMQLITKVSLPQSFTHNPSQQQRS